MCWSSCFNLSHAGISQGGCMKIILLLFRNRWAPAAYFPGADLVTWRKDTLMSRCGWSIWCRHRICSHTGNRHPVQGGAPQLLLPLKIRNCSHLPTPAAQAPQTGAPRSLESSRKGVSTIHSLWAWDIKIKHFGECVLCPEERFLEGGWLIQEILVLQ